MNIGNPGEFTILECAQAVLEVTGSKSELRFEALPEDDPTRRCPDITKARALLGWEPRITLREGLRNRWSSSGTRLASRALQAASFLQNEGCLKVTYYVKLIQTQGARGPVAGPAQITNLTISPYHEPAITNLWSRTRNHEFAPLVGDEKPRPGCGPTPAVPLTGPRPYAVCGRCEFSRHH